VRIAPFVLVVVLVGCGTKGQSQSPVATASPEAKTLPSASVTVPAASASVAPTIEPLRVTVARTGKTFALAVQNTGDAAIEIEDELHLERRDGTKWAATYYVVTLVKRCSGGPPVCTAIAGGATLKFPEWTGMSCSPLCPCRANAEIGAGEYRFVAKRCGSGATIASEPFEIT